MDAKNMHDQPSSFDIFLDNMDASSVSSLESESSHHEEQRNSRRRVPHGEIQGPSTPVKVQASMSHTYSCGKDAMSEDVDSLCRRNIGYSKTLPELEPRGDAKESLCHLVAVETCLERGRSQSSKKSAAPSPPQRQPSGEASRADSSTTIDGKDLPHCVTRVSSGGLSNCTLPRHLGSINGADITPSFFCNKLPPRKTSQGTAETAFCSICQSALTFVDEPTRDAEEEGHDQVFQRLWMVLPKKPDILKKPMRQISTGNAPPGGPLPSSY